MRIVHITLAVLFLLFTIVQFNDPDPLLWIAIYGSMVALCVLAAFKKFYPYIMIVQGVLFLIYCVLLWSGVSQWFASDEKEMLFDDIAKMQYPYIEESREFLGLAICLVVIALYLWLAFRNKKVSA